MKRSTLQLVAWWGSDRTAVELLPDVAQLLRDCGFAIVGELVYDRKREWVSGWSLVSLLDKKTWFGLVAGAEGPWLDLCTRLCDAPMAGLYERLLHAVIRELRPLECVLCRTNADALPELAVERMKGGLQRIVNMDADPPIEARPGDPNWFEMVGEELRYFDAGVLERSALEPEGYAKETGRDWEPFAGGFLFDGEWTLWRSK